jgi:predicted nucleotide-binding protein
LIKGEIERPSDFDGVVYISLDDADWQMRLGRELQAACVGAGDLGLARLKAAFSEARPT